MDINRGTNCILICTQAIECRHTKFILAVLKIPQLIKKHLGARDLCNPWLMPFLYKNCQHCQLIQIVI